MSRELCKTCGKPIIILDNKMETALDTLDIEQVTKFGCLNKSCELYNTVIRETRQPVNQ